MTEHAPSQTLQFEIRLSLMERTIEQLQQAINDISDSNRQISQSLQRLVVIEERHAETREALNRAFKDIKSVADQVRDQERLIPDNAKERLQAIELRMPSLVETRTWIITGVISLIGLVGVTAYKVIFSANTIAQAVAG